MRSELDRLRLVQRGLDKRLTDMEEAMEVTIRIWDGCVVRQVVRVGPTGSTTLGAIGGAENSTSVDIDLDPWRGIIVDRRVPHPIPISIRGEE